ncbi:hypothetical protein OOK47_41355 [Streptomyces sp. NBC_00268]|nr:hypothetical protein [Streptomyces sp. NBC_00268]MCX5188925.1 hypothetical protein [Streptomyces sp. NBC_00268]
MNDPLPGADLAQLRSLPPEDREHDVLDEDVARLSLLKHANLNMLGHCSIRASVPAGGGLRPLRDPVAPELDEDDGGQD